MSAPPFTTTRLGKLYQGDPLPVVPEATTYYPAGAVTFGVEGRALYEDGHDTPWAGGPTLHVFETGSGHEHLRFDAFPGEEHYHYLTPGVQNHWVGFDTVADGEFIDWALHRIRTKLPKLLQFAGATRLAEEVDQRLIADVLDDVEKHLRSRDLRVDGPLDGQATTTIGPDDLATALDGDDEIALLDVRELGAAAQQGTLLLATPLPLSEIEFRVRRFIPRLATAIVVIDDGTGALADAAATILSGLGYTSVRQLSGGTTGWTASGREVYTSVQALGQSFGEYLERAEHTPHATVAEVQALVDAGADVLFLDSRPIDEFTAHSLPQGISAPGAEIVARGLDLISSPDTVVVVNCAGRTRSIVGAQALINAGVPNRVVALEGGTMTWSLEGHALAHGLHRQAPAPTDPTSERHTRAAGRLLDRFGIGRIDWARARRLTSDTAVTTYLVDVRTPEEFDADHVAGSISAPSWDVAPWAFRHLATLNASIIVIDDGAGLRAALTGSWFVQLGWHNVSALLIDDVPADERTSGAEPSVFASRATEARHIEPTDLHAIVDDFTIVDVARSDVHAAGHIPGARFATRSALIVSPDVVPRNRPLAITSPDGVLAGLVAADLTERLDRPVVAVRGGTQAWQDAGLTLESGLVQPLSAVDDLALSPWQQDDKHAAFREYLRWEIALVDQLDRDSTTPFTVK
jgi:rhodanese-related sulfurtransferase